jgi:hypothetical protein
LYQDKKTTKAFSLLTATEPKLIWKITNSELFDVWTFTKNYSMTNQKLGAWIS